MDYIVNNFILLPYMRCGCSEIYAQKIFYMHIIVLTKKRMSEQRNIENAVLIQNTLI